MSIKDSIIENFHKPETEVTSVALPKTLEDWRNQVYSGGVSHDMRIKSEVLVNGALRGYDDYTAEVKGCMCCGQFMKLTDYNIYCSAECATKVTTCSTKGGRR